MRLVALGPVLTVGDGYPPAAAAHMRCHAHALVRSLYGRRRRADLHDLLHQVVRHAVEVPVEGYVIVDVHARTCPFADLESLTGQWLQRRFVERFEDTRATAIPLAEGPVVEPV